ncbi:MULTISPECIES: phosphotransferase [Gemella]|uniref:phosphotransferase n=1 Tax=Gemella TaxID=1378 RepID=UPI000767E2CE|nr:MULTISPECIES: phosphotransferase [Gemella]AME09585.1 choline kinase [Gemella sp. oral taxon 928]AXI27187.1 choline kinase [Gemella sp. ND 6198]
MYKKEKLEKILEEKIITMIETSYGITNKNYIVHTEQNSYFYRTQKDDTKLVNKENEKEAIKLLKNEPYFLNVIHYNNNNLITPYQKNSKTFISQKNLSNIIEIAKLLKKFHSKKFQAENSFNIVDTFYSYFNLIDELDIDNFIYLVDEIKKVYKPDRLCHNDLVEGNFLFTENNLFLIDYEYAGQNDYYFDIASFISENELDYQETITFLKAYFTDKQCDFNKLDIFLRFCDLLWYTWATLLYEKRGEEIYHEIAVKKYQSLKTPRKIIY